MRVVRTLIWLVAAVFLSVVFSAQAGEWSKQRHEPLPLLNFKGKPFFVIGSFDSFPHASVKSEGDVFDLGWLKAGGNTARRTLVAPWNEEAEKRLNDAVAFCNMLKDNPEYSHIGVIVELLFDMWCDKDTGVLTPQKRAEVQSFLARAVSELGRTGQVIGYTIDEPENHLHRAFKAQGGEDGDKGLGEYMVKGMSWITETIHDNDPNAYFMPIIAWWNMYDVTADLYDANLPNSYPSPQEQDFADILYDSCQAAEAARRNGKTFVYMPGMFNILDNLKQFKEGGYPDRHQQRYECFAPLTQGAAGIFGWRLARCTQKYREAVVYPTMKELDDLKPWFMGRWLDEAVTSNRDKASVDYLKKFPKLIRLVEGEKRSNETKEVTSVGDCSYCLRGNSEDGSLLLLVVNNMRETLKVNFTFHPKLKISETGIDYFSGKKVTLSNSRFRDIVYPLGVRAYIFQSE